MQHFHNDTTHNRKMILVIDDDFDILNFIKLALQKTASLNVFGFTYPNLALEHFEINATNYRLVICDIRMPGMNGFEFGKRIKKITCTMPVLLMSAFDVNSDELLLTSLNSGKIEGFIQKPISLRELISVVQKQLKITISSS